MASIWNELRRRSVFKVGAAYAVVAWLLVQIADVVLPAFELPGWLLRAFLVLIAIGFLVTVVLAWIYELTPEGVVRTDDVTADDSITRLTGKKLNFIIIGLLVVLIGFLIVSNYVIEPHEVVGTMVGPSIAVLPFDNHSASPEDAYFADGLAEELLSVLGRVPELEVASRRSSFFYKNNDADIDEIAAALRVESVLSGSVRRDGNRIRVSAELAEADRKKSRWNETYDRTLDDILEIQSDIASSVATAIVPVLSPDSQARIESHPTENTQAYDYYLRGRELLRQPAEMETLTNAIELFEDAIELDSDFARATAALCEAHLGAYEVMLEAKSFEDAERACKQALILDDGLWEVHLALGNLYLTNGQHDRAVVEIDLAIAEQPNSADSYLALAAAYVAQNRDADAEEAFLLAEEVDRDYWGVHRAYGNYLYDIGRYDEAIARHVRVTELVPDSGIGYDNLGNTYLALGELAEAEKAFNASPLPSRWTYMNRGLVYYYQGDYSSAVADQKRSLEIAPSNPDPWGFIGDAYRQMSGNDDRANAAYARAIDLANTKLEVDPGDWSAVGRLALSYAYTGEYERSAINTQELFVLTDDPYAHYLAARIRVHSGDSAAAINHLQKVIEGGWTRALISVDPDFAHLAGIPAFDQLIGSPQ